MKVETVSFSPVSGWSQPLEELSDLDSSSTLVLIFGAPVFIQHAGAIRSLTAMFPQSIVMGCSTAGEIFETSVRDGSLSVGICRFERTQLKVATATIKSSEHSKQVGRELAEQLEARDLSGLFVLSDGLNVNGSALVDGIKSLYGDVPLTGGMAADGNRFKQSWIVDKGLPVSGMISLIGFYGVNFTMAHGSQGGWDIFGPERTITRSVCNRLFELDGRPALDLYKEYLGDMASGLPATALFFPLQLRRGLDDSKHLVRTILAVDEETKSMVFAGDVPQGYLAQLMRGNFDRLVDGAANAAEMLTSLKEVEGDALAIAISCVGRRLVLGERVEEEVEATRSRLAPSIKQIGFYSYGEISPFVRGAACELHNQTMTMTVLGEKSGGDNNK